MNRRASFLLSPLVVSARSIRRYRRRVWGGDFAARLAAIGIKSVTTPIRGPGGGRVGRKVRQLWLGGRVRGRSGSALAAHDSS